MSEPLNVTEAAAYLGFKLKKYVSIPDLYDLVGSEHIKRDQEGLTLEQDRFSVEELNRYVSNIT